MIAAFDISTKRLDCVRIALDPDNGSAPTWRTVHRAKDATDVVAWAADATRQLLSWGTWGRDDYYPGVPSACVVEIPAGRVHPSLAWVYGAVHGQCSRVAPTTGFYPAQWRRELGCGASKAVAAAWITERYDVGDLDEHGVDAFGLALAYRQWTWSEHERSVPS